MPGATTGARPQADANVPPPGMSAVEHDWLRQAKALDAGSAAYSMGQRNDAGRCGRGGRRRQGRQVRLPHGTGAESLVAGRPGPSDAAGAHRGLQPARLRTRAAQRRHADLLTSDDGQTWTKRYDNQGKHFGGVAGAKPLEVTFGPGEVKARFVRLQIPSPQPIFFHLDEVEIYGAADPAQNLALDKPADQSSLSIWSTSKLTGPPVAGPVPLPTGEILQRGRLLAADLKQAGLDTAPFERELDAVAARLAELPAAAADDARRSLYFEARRAVRRLAFANPLLQFDQLLFVKRFTQETYPDVCLNHMPWVSRPGGDMCVLASPLADEAGKPAGAQHPGRPARAGPRPRHGPVVGRRPRRLRLRQGEDATRRFSRGRPRSARAATTSTRLAETIEPTHIFEIGIDGAACGS